MHVSSDTDLYIRRIQGHKFLERAQLTPTLLGNARRVFDFGFDFDDGGGAFKDFGFRAQTSTGELHLSERINYNTSVIGIWSCSQETLLMLAMNEANACCGGLGGVKIMGFRGVLK